MIILLKQKRVDRKNLLKLINIHSFACLNNFHSYFHVYVRQTKFFMMIINYNNNNVTMLYMYNRSNKM